MNSILKVFILLLICCSIAHSQKLGKHTLEEWQTIIDTAWGEGLSTETKLKIFDLFWNAVDRNYAGFNNLDIDWQALKNKYRPEVLEGVSRGRFAAIMNQLVLALKEIHTHANDLFVRGDSLHPGKPLLAFHSVYQPFNNGHFGAGLTPLPDSSVLVYAVVDNHPLGLERGDRILGYDGIAWKDLYKLFLQAELPITGPAYLSVGTSEKSILHIWLMSAGLNWHLCDTIDVLKYGSNDTLHLFTNLLLNQDMNLFCAEQLPVAGVPMIDLSNFWEESNVSWGIVEKTRIGYIYVSRWWDLEKIAFTNAVNSLLDDYQTTGLILDFRGNPGGDSKPAFGGFSRLFNFDVDIFNLVERSDLNDHFSLAVAPNTKTFNGAIVEADKYLFDRPIAVLTGPLTFSAADFNSLRLKYHPMSRTFGKPTNSAFTNYDENNPFHNLIENNSNYPDWEAGYAPMNAYLLSNPGQYLLHVGFDVDEEVWLTQDDVAKGEDTVVKRAIEWIQNLAHAHDVAVDRTYIKPSSGNVTISAQVENPNNHDLSVRAYISLDDTTVIDSVYLSQKDSIWTAPWSVGEGENIYHVSVKTEDKDSGTSRTIPNVAHFATAGPVDIDSLSSVRRSRFYPTQLTFDIFLKNKSNTATIKDVRAIISPDTSDPCFEGIGLLNNISFGDIVVSESAIGRGFSVFMKESCSGDTIFTIPFSLDISSEGHVLWNDAYNLLVVNVDEDEEIRPLTFKLEENYPNPFNPKTMISYQLAKTSEVELSIYNILGQKVATLVNKKQPAGSYQVQWDASVFASGIYLYQLTAKGQKQKTVLTKKLILLK